MSEKKKIKFNKYNSEETFKQDEQVDNATFSVVRTVIDEDGDDTNDIKDLYLHRTKLTDRYNSRVTKEDAVTSVTVGGLNAGTPLSELKEMSLGQVIDKMLFKTFFPSYTGPSLHISGDEGDKLVGTSYSAIQNFTTSRGSYTLDVNNGLPYAGEPKNETFKNESGLNGGTVGTSNITRRASIEFEAGPTPKDSDGNPFTGTNIPYSGGKVYSNILTIYPYYNWYATGVYVASESQAKIDYTAKITLTGLSVIRNMGISAKTVMLDISHGDSADKQTIKVPGTITEVKTFADGEWKDYAFEDWYGRTTDTINGKTYSVYTMKDSAYSNGGVGGCRLKFKIIP